MACPFCGKHTAWRKRLQQHIVKFHRREVTEKGTQRISQILYWRQKAGMRRVSYECIAQVIENRTNGQKAIGKGLLFDVLKEILTLCLVKIASDEV